MAANRTALFYHEFTNAAGYTVGNSKTLEAQAHNLLIAADGGTTEFVLNGVAVGGTKVDGKVLTGEKLIFNGLCFDKIAVRGSGTVRVWAWKQT